MSLLKEKTGNSMGKVTLDLQGLQASRVFQDSQVSQGLPVHQDLRDLLVCQERWDPEDPKVTWAITRWDKKEKRV